MNVLFLQFTKEESEIFGLGVKVEIKKMTPVMEDLHLLPMWMGKHSFKFVLKPGTTRPNKIEFKVIFFPTENIASIFLSLNTYYDL